MSAEAALLEPPADTKQHPTQVDSPRKMRHFAALDGLRGVAVIWVLLVHLIPYSPQGSRLLEWGFKIVEMGSVGVDLFFVISGFLITGILIDSRRKENRYRTFYVRRSLRIFPLYYATLAGVFILPPLFGIGGAGYDALASTQWWHWSYLSNYYAALHGGNGDLHSTWFSLSHFWSLAVEEQFYLVWPILVFHLSRKRLVQACFCLIAFATLTRVAIVATDANYWWSLTSLARCDCLAFGSLIAIAARDPVWWQSFRRYAVLGLLIPVPVIAGLILWNRGFWGDTVLMTSGLILSVWFGSMVVHCTSERRNVFAVLMDNRFFRFFGKYSYGIYILHPFVERLLINTIGPFQMYEEVFGQGVPAQAVYFTVNATLSIVVALLSWNLMEKHLLHLKDVLAPSVRPDPEREVPRPFPAKEATLA